MSILHKSFRSVIKVERTTYSHVDQVLPVRLVYWAIIDRRTSRSVYSRHYAVSVYVGNGVRNYGISARMPRKSVRIDISDLNYNEAFTEALTRYLAGKRFKASVTWFDRHSGEGCARGLNGEGTFRVHACNIPGKRTWYPETACVYYVEGQCIDLEYLDHAPYAKPLTNGTLDDIKWNSLDHSKLAFRCDETGKALSGLFSNEEVKS